jgi:predicted nucleic acid-binding protein
LTLFCDASALIKLDMREPFTDEMLAAAADSRTLAVCRITWAEAMAALARRSREAPSDTDIIDTVRQRLRTDWDDDVIVEGTRALVERAGDYADTFALRGYDSVQLTAACALSEATRDR